MQFHTSPYNNVLELFWGGKTYYHPFYLIVLLRVLILLSVKHLMCFYLSYDVSLTLFLFFYTTSLSPFPTQLSLILVSFPGVYAFGLFTTTIFANAGQVVTGNQTPHFLSACRPNYTALGCQSTMQYIAERRACTGNPLIVMSARKSFPSKDAALSVYSAVYTVVGRSMLEVILWASVNACCQLKPCSLN